MTINNISLDKLLCCLLLICFSQLLHAQPKSEIRAVWLTINYGLDWPEKPFQNRTDIEIQRNELDRIFDSLQAVNLNVIFFQTRIRGNVIYPSQIESRSEFVKSDRATVDYDPLAYAVEACHKRGLECHAWFVVYPLGSVKDSKKTNHLASALRTKSFVKSFKKELYLDPGNPQTDTYLLSLIREIVFTYDIDGIHFDYIRYPDTPANFPDKDTYQQYGNGKDKAMWRRENINRLVYTAYDTIKSMKPWVQVSSSVVGMYKVISEDGRYWTAYSSVFQDPIDWLDKGKHDFIVPMMYYSGTRFFPFLEDWTSRNNERLIIPGLGVFQMEQKELNWSANILYEQIEYSRKAKTQGNVFFRAKYLLNNKKEFSDGLRRRFYQTPALLPPLTWLSKAIPEPPSSLSAHKIGAFLHLDWDKTPAKDSQPVFYNLYRSETFPVDTTNPNNLVVARLRDNHYEIPLNNRISSGYYYIVTGYDRYHNESRCSGQVYFATGNFEK